MSRFRAVAIVALLAILLTALSSCISSAGAPTITTTTIPSTATIGMAYAGATISTSGGTIPLSYSIINGGLPKGLNLLTSNNQGTIAGTPVPQTTGPYTFTVQVSDSNNPARTAHQQYTITLGLPTAPVAQCPTGNAMPCALPSGTVGVAYPNETFTATGTGPLRWSATGLPGGLMLNQATGVLSGTPAQFGNNLQFTVQVTDVAGQTSANLTCTVTIAAPAQLKITPPAAPPGGVVGTPYGPGGAGFQLSATGGLPPYFWRVSSGTFPPGLNNPPTNGLISGTPTIAQPSPYQFQIQVFDSETPAMVATSPQLSITITASIIVTITNKFTTIDALATPVTLNANVQNDPFVGGVTWKLQSGTPLTGCSPTCGTLVPSGTSNLMATYTPPKTVPAAPNNTPTITATAVDDTGKSDTNPFTINPAGAAAGATSRESAMTGSFAYLMKGFDANGAVAIAGSFQADGTGKITGGVEDVNRAGTGPQTNLPIVPGSSSYTLGADNRGFLVLATAAGQTMFRFSLAAFSNGAPTEGNIIEFDDNTGDGTRGSGIIRAQDPSSFSNDKFAGSYAFGLSGSGAAGDHVALAGTLTSDGKGNIVGGTFDRNDAGNLTTDSSRVSGTYNIPAGSSTGRGMINATLNGTPITLVAYMINGSEVILADLDQISPTNPLSSGEALESMGPFSNATLAGSHILRATALNRSGSNPGARATIGVLTFDGKNTGGVTGTLFNDEAGQSSTTTVLRGAATYSVDQRTGRITFTGVGTDSMVGYIVHGGSGVTAFLVGTDGGAADGALEFQSYESANFDPSAFTGAYSFGTDENVDYSTTNESRAASFDSSTSVVNGESDQSQPRTNGLLANQSYSNAFVFSAEGIGTAGTNPAVTNGVRVFFIDEEPESTHPRIIIAEKQ